MLCTSGIRRFQEFSVKDESNGGGDELCHGKGQPEIVQTQARKQETERYKQHNRADHGQQ